MAEIWMFLDDLDEDDEDDVVLPRTRTIRTREDPFDVYHEREFKRRYRMSKDSATRLNDLIKDHFQSLNNRGCPLSSMERLLVTLHHLGYASYQRDSADISHISQFCT